MRRWCEGGAAADQAANSSEACGGRQPTVSKHRQPQARTMKGRRLFGDGPPHHSGPRSRSPADRATVVLCRLEASQIKLHRCVDGEKARGTPAIGASKARLVRPRRRKIRKACPAHLSAGTIQAWPTLQGSVLNRGNARHQVRRLRRDATKRPVPSSKLGNAGRLEGMPRGPVTRLNWRISRLSMRAQPAWGAVRFALGRAHAAMSATTARER
jgi:hypothetical protein